MTAQGRFRQATASLLRRYEVPVELLAALLLGLFAIDNLLLLRFLGLTPVLVIPLVAGGSGTLAWFLARAADRPDAHRLGVPLSNIALALAVGLALFVLGGQGRFFYANADWQIRSAVLNDMATNAWPYAYDLGGTPVLLRAPLGMYLIPALVGVHGWHEIALLASNTLRLGLLLALASLLFDTNVKRLAALAVFFLFSGWDILGTVLVSHYGAHVSWNHLESWNQGFQYSSHITQAFWVPNHAMAGWTCAVMYELWRRGKIPIGWFAASVPLVAIWSPLAIMGAVPFVLVAGVTTLRHRAFTRSDVLQSALALAVALPSLWFMHLDAGEVGGGLSPPGWPVYVLLLAFEVLPLVLPPLLSKTAEASERLTLQVALLCLMFMPFFRIGISSDFQMRASIMPLALTAIAYSGWLLRLCESRPRPKLAIGLALGSLAIGALTPAFEIHRTLINDPSPVTRCSLLGVWNRQTGLIAPYGTYVARTSSLPWFLRAIPVTAGRKDPAQCWDRKWISPDAPR